MDESFLIPKIPPHPDTFPQWATDQYLPHGKRIEVKRYVRDASTG
jgi:hypothetical protein